MGGFTATNPISGLDLKLLKLPSDLLQQIRPAFTMEQQNIPASANPVTITEQTYLQLTDLLRGFKSILASFQA